MPLTLEELMGEEDAKPDNHSEPWKRLARSLSELLQWE